MADRDLNFSGHMSDTEALMWNVEKDPWLSSAMGSVAVFDTPIDFDLLTAKMANAVANIARLRERVAPSINGIAPPRWVSDTEFQLSDHLREYSLAGDGTDRDFLDLIAQLFTEPFDRTRPLWTFYVIQGLEGGRSAFLNKMHHSISDGIGAIRMAEYYMDFERNPEPPAEVDLREIIELAAAQNPAPDSFKDVVKSSVGHLARRQLGVARRAAGEVALWGADPGRITDVVDQATGAVKVVGNQVGSTSTRGGGSPLWKDRSRHRRLETFSVPLKPALAAAKALEGKLNDFLVAGSVLASIRYHAERDVTVDAFNLSFVVSTRADGGAGGNSFAPVMVSVSGAPESANDVFVTTRDTMTEGREAAQTGASASSDLLAGLATLLPTSVLTRTGRARAASQDFATSNLRASPIPVFIAGAEIQQLYPIGPVAGTAFNLTAMSYTDSLDVGVMIDPVAVDAPGELRDHLVAAYAELIELGAS